MKCILNLLLLFALSVSAAAQSSVKASYIFLDCEVKYKLKSSFKDHKEVDAHTRELISKLQSDGYLEASADTIVRDSIGSRIVVHCGEKYSWAFLKPGNVDASYLKSAGFKQQNFNGERFNPTAFSKLINRILSHYENEGRPFASIRLDSIKTNGKTLSAVLHAEPGAIVRIDSIRIRGNSSINETYLFNYLSIKPGDLYNESIVSKIDNRIKEIPFLQLTKPTEIAFTPKYTRILIYVEKKKANQFDGLLGFLPDENGNLLITGQAHMNLMNALNRGDAIEVNWKKLQPLTQDLFTRFNYPFLFRSPFGTEGQLHLYKKDTTYIDVRKYVSLNYFLKRGTIFKVFIQDKTTSLLSVRGLEFVSTLPVYADVRNRLYGIGFRTENLDYRLNPRRGYIVNLNGGAGSRTIKRNAKINQEVYDKTDLHSEQYQLDIQAELFIPLFKNSTVRISTLGSWLESERYFVNELYRIGGLRTLRGFDEESIYADAYSINSIEYRLLIDRNSYVHLFYDQAFYKNTLTRTKDEPFGFGAGISFETKAGIFSLSYALGKQFDNPIFLRAAKVHFGIVNYF